MASTTNCFWRTLQVGRIYIFYFWLSGRYQLDKKLADFQTQNMVNEAYGIDSPKELDRLKLVEQVQSWLLKALSEQMHGYSDGRTCSGGTVRALGRGDEQHHNAPLSCLRPMTTIQGV